jgi:hypothetical protein
MHMRFLNSVLFLLLCGTATVATDMDTKVQKHQLEELLAAAVPFSRQMLASHGEFYPYGATMDGNGKITNVGGYTGDEHPKPTDLIELLRAAFKKQGEEGKIMACALVYDIRTIPPGQTEKTDAIAVDLDHRDGLSIIMVYPYKIAADKTVTFAAPFASKGKGEIFTLGKTDGTNAPANGSQPQR